MFETRTFPESKVFEFHRFLNMSYKTFMAFMAFIGGAGDDEACLAFIAVIISLALPNNLFVKFWKLEAKQLGVKVVGCSMFRRGLCE